MRRAGELLKVFQDQKRGLLEGSEPCGGGSPTTGENGRPRTQREAAARAGMSKDQEVTARRVAEVPEVEFEEAIESDDPPSVTERIRPGSLLDESDPRGAMSVAQVAGCFDVLAPSLCSS